MHRTGRAPGSDLHDLRRCDAGAGDAKVADAAYLQGLISAEQIDTLTRNLHNWRNVGTLPNLSRSKESLATLKTVLNPNDDEQVNLAWELLTKKKKHATVAAENSNRLTDFSFAMPNIYKVVFGMLSTALLLWLVTSQFEESGDASGRHTYIDEIPASQLRLSIDGFVLPSSDKELITREKIKTLNSWELYVARNEIYARHGRMFSRPWSQCLHKHFNGLPEKKARRNEWYIPNEKASPKLSPIEQQNVDNIYTEECAHRGGQYKCNGRLNVCR